jgi:3-methylcrotonyl-CoA carboxylase alpha subunit
VLGVRTNIGLLARVLSHPRFVAGDIDTSFIDTERDALAAAPDPGRRLAAVAAAAWAHARLASVRVERGEGTALAGPPDPWDSLSRHTS